jgi:exonuclease III
MKRIYWNTNGLRGPQKLKNISDLIKEHDLNFIALSETGRSKFMPSFLKSLCAGMDYLWHTMAPKGRYGGMLVVVDLQVMDIGAINEGDYYVKFHFCNKSDSFKWAQCMVQPKTIKKRVS